MSTENYHPDNRLAFSTRCLPGSEAERKEREQLETFQRTKAAQDAIKLASAEQRHQDYEAYYEANRERIDREEAARQARKARRNSASFYASHVSKS